MRLFSRKKKDEDKTVCDECGMDCGDSRRLEKHIEKAHKQKKRKSTNNRDYNNDPAPADAL